MTPEQSAIIKADILASPDLAAYPLNSDGSYAIADLYRLPAQGTWIVWRSDVSIDEIMRNGMDWARVDNLSVGKARIWDWLGRLGSFDASKTNVRAGIDAAWVGTAADLVVRAAIYVHCKRQANRLEKLLSTGTGTDASPAVMGFEGGLSYQAVDVIRAS